MTPDERRFEELIESVADRHAIDWERVEADAAGGEERTRYQAVRDVERMAEFHRSLQRDAPGAGTTPAIERWGELLVLEHVGAGASGDLYRAWDPALQREVALKLLRPGGDAARGSRDWLEEARTLARVRDPNVVSVYGAAEHDGRAGLWMEFLHGASLEDEIARRGALSPSEVASIGAQIARALAAVHAAGALHRDVKPANVILEPGGRAVLTDFGLGRRRLVEGDPGVFSGTPMFMSPQRLAGAPARAADDLYALGVALRWALAGSPPFRTDSLDALRAAVVAGPARALRDERPGAPAGLVAAIDRAMAPAPTARFESASAMHAAFERAAPSRPPAPARRARGVAWGAAVVVAAAVAAWLVLSHGPGRPRAAPPPSAAYDVSASFLRSGPDGDVRLSSGDRVAPGDRLTLQFHSTRRVWVYVLDADDRGACYLLFPQPLFDRRNPLPADSTLMLPGTRDGRENAWTVTSRGGREHLLVVASPKPVTELESELAALPAPVPNRRVDYARVGAGAVERLRGVGGVSDVTREPAPSGPAAIFDRVRALAGAESGVHGTWVRQVVLENPLR